MDSLSKSYPPVRKGYVGFRDLVDTLQGRREEILALKDISFSIGKGEWFGLLGPNGAGKTTFCDILLDITTPSSGRILLDGIDVNRQHNLTRGKICAMQYWFFQTRVSVRDTLLLAGSMWMLDPDEAEDRMYRLVDLFGVRDKIDEWNTRLSAGTAIKVLIIATLMSNAELLVFDEPTRFVDVLARRKVYEILKDAQRERGTTIVWTTHNLREAEEACDRIAVINNRLVMVTTPSRLTQEMGRSNLEDAFVQLLQDEMKESPKARDTAT